MLKILDSFNFASSTQLARKAGRRACGDTVAVTGRCCSGGGVHREAAAVVTPRHSSRWNDDHGGAVTAHEPRCWRGRRHGGVAGCYCALAAVQGGVAVVRVVMELVLMLGVVVVAVVAVMVLVVAAVMDLVVVAVVVVIMVAVAARGERFWSSGCYV